MKKALMLVVTAAVIVGWNAATWAATVLKLTDFGFCDGE